ncbi:sperm-associated antigen 5 isoform X1 [Erythrolamprus reginae]|uniref:sperm-associated antigen 5 isoform X1 n=1 Tax=Erythrolamprus reginae TaxID=121349 RepID=UPI00396D0174
MAESGSPGGRGQSGPEGSSTALGVPSWAASLDWLEQLFLGDPQRSLLTKPTRSPLPSPGSQLDPCLDPASVPEPSTSTPISGASAGAWAAPAGLQDVGPKSPLEQAAPTASPEGQDLPAVGQDPGTAHASLASLQRFWDSPLSPLDNGPGVSLAGKEPSQQSPMPPCLTCATARTPFAGLPQQNRGTSVTPVSVASVAAWTSQLSLREAGVNTSPAEKATTTDSTAETDSLLWHCSRDQLRLLSRGELEGRLESTLIILEALSRQIQAAQDLRQSAAPLGPADQREAATQTPTAESSEAEERLYCNLYLEQRLRLRPLQESQKNLHCLLQRLEGANEEMRTWSSDSRQLRMTVDASFQHLQDDRRSLCQQKQTGGLLAQAKAQVQRWGQKHREMVQKLEAALKAKDAANLVLESVQASAATKIRTLELSAKSRQRLWVLLQEAKALQGDLLSGHGCYIAKGDDLTAGLQADWAQMRLDYQRFRSIVRKCLAANQKMAEEVEAARTENARYQEVCEKLEERTVELEEAQGRVEGLEETNARLEQDLQAALGKVTESEKELEQLQEEQLALAQQLQEKTAAIQKLQEEATRLAQEKDQALQERDSSQRDLWEAMDCREFLEQENQVARRQLSETEEELMVSLAALRERSSQLEDLKDAQQTLQQEQESLRAELDGARAEIEETKLGLEGLSGAMLELGGVHVQVLEAAHILQTGQTGEAAHVAPQSSTRTPARRTPHRLGLSLVDSVLRAASVGARKTPGLWSETTAFMHADPAPPAQLSEIQTSLASHTRDLRGAVEQLHLLARSCQEDLGGLQGQILQLEQQLTASRTQHQAEMDACHAAQGQLSKALQLKIQSEKELQQLLRQQEEKEGQLRDQKREGATLREEVAQLKAELQKSKTEATALWDELNGTRLPNLQEKIWLRQEVGKLKELLLQRDTERTKALTSHLTQVRSLEERLCQAQQQLRHQERVKTHLRQALSTLPVEVSSLTEVQRLVAISEEAT